MSEPHEEVDSLQEGIQALGQVVENTEELRRSSRSRNPTAKMLEFQKNEAQKKEKKLACLYDQWKMQARKARNELKSDIPESQIASLVDAIERARDNVLSIYSEIRDWCHTINRDQAAHRCM